MPFQHPLKTEQQEAEARAEKRQKVNHILVWIGTSAAVIGMLVAVVALIR